jgi:hypothetical protein
LIEFVQRMAQIKPAVDKDSIRKIPRRSGQALSRGFSGEWHDMLAEINKGAASTVAKDALTSLAEAIKTDIEALNNPLETLAQSFEEAGQKSTQSWGSFVSFAKDENSIFGTSMTVDIDGAVLKSLAILGRLPSEGIAAITSWANTAIAEFQRMAAGAIQSAKDAASALASIGSGAAKNVGSIGSQNVGAGSFGGMGPEMFGQSDSGSDFGSQSPGILTPSGDAGTIDFGDLGGGDLPAFATGGQLTVTGSGGTDTTLVQFKATPGEVVTVSTPEQMAQAAQQSGGIQGVTTAPSQPSAVGVVSATPDDASLATVKQITDAIEKSSIAITKQATTANDKIIEALLKLTAATTAPVLNPATGLPVASAKPASPYDPYTPRGPVGGGLASGSGSGGGAGSGGGSSFSVGNIAKQQAARRKLEDPETGGIQLGQGGGGQFGSTSGFYQGQGRSIRGSAGSISGRPVGQFAQHNPDALSGNAYDSGMSDFYGTNYDESGDFYGSISDYDSGISDFYGTNYDGGGDISGSISDYGDTGYYSDYGGYSGGYDSGYSGGYDSDAMDYGGGSYDAGYFATGGTFKVPGAAGSGIDKTLVSMHVTPGETVSVTPNGITMPTMAGSGQAIANADPSAANVQMVTKNITINVADKIQAADFIRSRAQMARGL